ncbi:unnamed protein product [Gongylonema pulchrum]|uniref:CHCH domain-containing protein n=1 Tax=Gongylonema pulchrum TaxID=637853 RepID=A0A183EP71_9BILA|nr:unnamed protein product [Gongylonema pulchrum]
MVPLPGIIAGLLSLLGSQNSVAAVGDFLTNKLLKMSLPMKVPKPVPPVKGSFPLDYEGQCKYEMLKIAESADMMNVQINEECRKYAKIYLQCRMDKGLMQRDDWKYLGFPENDER